MSNPASFAEIVDALRQAEAGLEVAVAHKPQTTKFVPSHVLALWAVKRVLERLPTEAAAMAATVPAGYVEALGLRLFQGSATDHTIRLRHSPELGDVPIYTAPSTPTPPEVAP